MSKEISSPSSLPYRLACSDIDGTLLNRERDLSDCTVQTLRCLDEKGIPFVMISARMPSAMRPFLAKAGINRPIVCFNGAYIESEIKPDGRPRVLRTRTMNYEVFLQMLTLLRRYPVHVSAFYKDTWYANGMDRWTEREIHNTRVHPEILPTDRMLYRFSCEGMSAHKVLVMGEKEAIEELYFLLSSLYGDHVDIYRSKDTYLEINAKAISKEKSLAVLAAYFGLTIGQIVAFGDSYNDIGMLSSAGLGVAVGNAKEVVKTAADRVTDENISDGVAKCLKIIFDI